jgi:hypothetical protein
MRVTAVRQQHMATCTLEDVVNRTTHSQHTYGPGSAHKTKNCHQSNAVHDTQLVTMHIAPLHVHLARLA